jgi:hypothetical protein
LATAALLSYPQQVGATQPLDLIQQAELMAPQRPELAWLHRSICQRLKCAATRSIEARLQELDPDNGWVWFADLDRAQQAESEAAITEAVMRIGASKKPTSYWNALQVMMFDALTVASPKESDASRGIEATGLLAAQILPRMQLVSQVCRADRFDVPGRREACDVLVTRMEQADLVIVQGLALSIQARWWPEGSAQRQSLRIRRRQLDYEMAMAGQVRWRMNRDMGIRLHAARQSESEEAVMLAVMRAYGIPLTAPSGWKDTWQSF